MPEEEPISSGELRVVLRNAIRGRAPSNPKTASAAHKWATETIDSKRWRIAMFIGVVLIVAGASVAFLNFLGLALAALGFVVAIAAAVNLLQAFRVKRVIAPR